jgi:hypothetical protein
MWYTGTIFSICHTGFPRSHRYSILYRYSKIEIPQRTRLFCAKYIKQTHPANSQSPLYLLNYCALSTQTGNCLISYRGCRWPRNQGQLIATWISCGPPERFHQALLSLFSSKLLLTLIQSIRSAPETWLALLILKVKLKFGFRRNRVTTAFATIIIFRKDEAFSPWLKFGKDSVI